MMEHTMHATEPYRVEAARTSFEPARQYDWSFQLVGHQGPPRSYRMQHERELHLIVVRNDLATFAHLHPMRDESGVWSVQLTLPRPGDYTAFLDVAPDDAPAMTLRLPLTAEGAPEAPAVHEPSAVAHADGYTVELVGEVLPGRASDIEFRITKGGEPVQPDPYLGAAGHLVAIRLGDLAYLHVHPVQDENTPGVRFMMHPPGSGTYRLFLQFLYDGEVRTAEFTLEVATTTENPAPVDAHAGHHMEH